MIGDAFERGQGEAVSAFLHPPRDPVLSFLERLAADGTLNAELVGALLDVRRRELGAAAEGAPADTPMNQRSVLFNDVSAAPRGVDGYWPLAARKAVADYLFEKGWRRRLTAEDVR